MKVEIWSDIACPWCFVGKRRFEKALAAFPERDALDIVWRSFELDPHALTRQDRPTVELLASKYRMAPSRAQGMLDNMTATGASEGIEFRFDRSISGNTFDAHRLIHFAATHDKRAEMVERLFRAYFTDGEAMGDRPTLARLAAEIGLDASAVTAMLSSDAYAADVRADEARAQTFGISGVPFFAIDEKYGVSGAQTSEIIVQALQQALSESDPVVIAAPSGDVCDDATCAI
jgi:predicted DsbA family dithiol-disulfide isomerase